MTELELLFQQKDIKAFAMDVDGVLTDGGLFYDSEGGFSVRFDVKDGWALAQLRDRGIPVAWITGRGGGPVESRSNELGGIRLFQRCKDKVATASEWARELGLELQQIAYLGDDVPDLGLLSAVGLSLAPSDAVQQVRDQVDFVLTRPGGHGAVRESIEAFLQTQNP